MTGNNERMIKGKVVEDLAEARQKYADLKSLARFHEQGASYSY